MPSETVVRVCVVGPGSHFLSGVSYYTERLASALTGRYDVSVVLLRRLMPARWYPGRARVGAELATLRYPTDAAVHDGVDWYWGRSIVGAAGLLRQQRPDFVVLQWWTGTVLHTLLALAWLARRRGARVVLEFHEVQDTGEAALSLARRYVDTLFPLLLRLVDGAVVHSEHDRPAVEQRYGLGDRPVVVVPHGPHHTPIRQPLTDPGDSTRTLLYFGVIRPYKGVEDLIRAFDRLPAHEADRLRLLVVGETWENHHLPTDLIDTSRYRDRIELVNRYVTDEELADFLAAADAVILPYHRSSASGPLHLAMSAGLPVVVTRVGGLPEAVINYRGAVLVPPCNVDELARALPKVAAMAGERFTDPHSWAHTLDGFAALFTSTGAGITRAPRRADRQEHHRSRPTLRGLKIRARQFTAATRRASGGDGRSLVGAAQVVGRSVAATMMLPLVPTRQYWTDRRLGVDTRGTQAAGHQCEPSRFRDAVRYEPILARPFRRLVRSLPAPEPGGWTFLDLGCGKGLTLVLAAEHGFGRAIGVDIDRALLDSARSNVNSYQDRTRSTTMIELLHHDAAHVRLPTEPTVLFLFNPFGERTMQQVAEAIQRSLDDRVTPLVVAYMNPVHEAVFDNIPGLRRVANRGERWAVFLTEPTEA